MTNKDIFKILQDNLDLVHKRYGEENILGIYAYGRVNDELYEDELKYEDITTEVIYIPTFEEVCINMPPLSVEIFDGKNNIVKVKDIRLIYRASMLGHKEMREALYTNFYIVNPRYSYMFIKLIREKRDIIAAGADRGIPAEELKIAILKIMRYAMNDNSAAVRFIKQLTDAEKLALDGIVQKYGEEGVFKQHLIASDLGLSRLTLTKLIGKMKEFEVAEIEHRGPEGTYFKVLDATLLNIKGEKI